MRPKKKATGAAKRKTSTPAKKKTRPAKAVKKNEKSLDPRKKFLRDGEITKERLLEWDKTRDINPITDLEGKSFAPVLTRAMEDRLDDLIKDFQSSHRYPVHCFNWDGNLREKIKSGAWYPRDANHLVSELESLLRWYRNCKKQEAYFANTSKTRDKIGELKRATQGVHEHIKSLSEMSPGYYLIDGVHKALYGVDTHETQEFYGLRPFFNDLENNLATLIAAFGYADARLDVKRGPQPQLLRDELAIELALLFNNYFDKPPTSTPDGPFIRFLMMVFGWVGINIADARKVAKKALKSAQSNHRWIPASD